MTTKTVTLSSGELIKFYIHPAIINVEFPVPNAPGGSDVRAVLPEQISDTELLSETFEEATVRVFRVIQKELGLLAPSLKLA